MFRDDRQKGLRVLDTLGRTDRLSASLAMRSRRQLDSELATDRSTTGLASEGPGHIVAVRRGKPSRTEPYVLNTFERHLPSARWA